ncbi:MAG: tRNA pseudouridine(55) synthase TruB [Candidatus Paceibacterota bacterium]
MSEMKNQQKEIVENILLIYKPTGVSSFGFINRFAKDNNIKKIGHAGTLDPFAEGLMIVGINEGTKKISEYVGLDKEYEVEMLIGKSTTTEDPEGDIVEEKKVLLDTKLEENIRKVFDSLEGTHILSVPQFSAKKIKGKPMYWYARKGEKLPEVKREMNILKSDLLEINQEDRLVRIKYKVKVSSGTYVRSITIFVGENLGFPAHTDKLIRTKIGEYFL